MSLEFTDLGKEGGPGPDIPLQKVELPKKEGGSRGGGIPKKREAKEGEKL